MLSANTNLGNLTVVNQTIYGTQANADIVLSPDGTGYVDVPKLRIQVGTLLEGTANITVTIANLTLSSVVDYSTSSSDNLVIGDYDLPNGVSGAGTGWAVYEFTTNPTPELQIGDHIAGVGIPFLSNVLHIGTGPNTNIIVTDKTITSAPPESGTQIFTTRDIVSAGLNISTIEDTDIILTPGTGGHIIAGSDILPFEHNVYTLGTPSKRFKEIWLGGGTIYILDETLGSDQAIGARDGNIYIAGGTGLTVGKFTFTGNTIALANPAEDFYVGAIGATGNLTVNRHFNVSSVDGAWKLFDINQTNGYVSIVSNVANSTGTAALEIVGARARDLISPNNPGILLHLTGTSTAPARIYNDSYGAANYSAYIGRKARGNSTVASGTVAGDIISRIGANPFDSSGVFAPISTMRMDFVVKETQTPTDRGNQIEFWTTANASASIARRVVIDDAGIALNTGGVKFVDSTVQTTAWLGDASLDTVNANVTAANAAIVVLQSNAAAQSTDIATLFSNAVTQNTELTTLTANAAAQSTDIATLFANAATQAVQIDSIATNAVNVVTAGFGMSVSRNNGTVGVDALGVTTVAGTANQVLVNAGTSAANAAITLTLPQSIAPSSTVTFANLTITGNLNVQGNINTSNNASIEQKILYLANTAPSQSDLDGGGIILGNVDAAFKRSFLYNFNSDTWDTDGAGLTTIELHVQDAIFGGNIFSNGHAHFGASDLTTNYNNAEVQIDSNRNDFSQLIHQNHNSGTNASTDFVATNDIGTDESNFIDLGINSSTYNNPDYSITGPNDGYLFVNGGNLAIGTQSAGDIIRFHTSGTTSADLRVTIDDDGLTSVGNVTAQYFVGSGQYLTDLYSNANVTAYLTTDSNIAAIWANITAIDAAWQANAAIQEDEISELRANITAANAAIVTANSAVVSYVNTLNSAMTANITAVNLQISNTSVAVFANAASQQVTINALGAGATAANLNISALQSSAATLASSINILFANAVAQESSIIGLRANIIAANAAIVTANSAVVSYVNTLNSAMTANITAANAAIVTANNAVVSYVNTLNSAMNSNVIAANGAIVTANNAVVSYVNTLNSAMTANVISANNSVNTANIYLISYINNQIGAVTNNWTANAAIQEDEISALRANINAANTAITGSSYGDANVAVYLPYNATIQAIQANVTAANAAIVTANSAIVTANSAVVSYVNTVNSVMNSNVIAANGAIVTANTGMKNYVDAQISTVALSWVGNAVAQENAISSLRANITAANAAIGVNSYSNVNVAAYLTSTTNVNIGNLRINDQTISGIVAGRDMNFAINDAGADFIFNSNLVPTLNRTFTLGIQGKRWGSFYCGPRSIDVDGVLIETDTDVGGGNLYVSNATGFISPSIRSNTTILAAGNITTTANVFAGTVVATNYRFDNGPTELGTDNSITIDFNNGSLQHVTVTGSATISFTNVGPGKRVTLLVTNASGSFSRTVTHGATAQHSTNGSTTFSVGTTRTSKFDFYCFDYSTANIYVSID